MTGLAATATLVHDFTMADIDAAAHLAVKRNKWLRESFERTDMLEAAWSSIVEELYSCECAIGPCRRTEPIHFGLLVIAGMNGISKMQSDQLRQHGKSASDGAARVGFTKYWLPIRKAKHWSGDGFSDQLCDRLALHQALGKLSDEQYQAVAAVAAFDGVASYAAEALGLGRDALVYRVATARKRIAEELDGIDHRPLDDRPSKEACRRGHARAEHGRRAMVNGYETWQCVECARERHRRNSQNLRVRRRLERESARSGTGK